MSFMPLRCSSTEEEQSLAYIAADLGLEKVGEPAAEEGAAGALLVCGLDMPVEATGLGCLAIPGTVFVKGLTGET